MNSDTRGVQGIRWELTGHAVLPVLFIVTSLILVHHVSPLGISAYITPFADNLPPEADAGQDITGVVENDEVELDGSGSVDEDLDNCTWYWYSTSHPFIGFKSINTSSPTFLANVTGTVRITLLLTDPGGLNDTDEVMVDVGDNQNPRARINLPVPSGDPYVAGEPIEFSANGTSDQESSIDDLLFDWRSNVSGHLSDQRYFTGILEWVGWHTIELNVSDPNGGWATARVEIRIREPPEPPEARIDRNRLKLYPNGYYLKGETVNLNGTKSSDPNTGDVLEYEWSTNRSGGRVIGYGEVLEAALEEGLHNVTLKITDLDGLTDRDSVLIEIRNRPPIARIIGPSIVNETETALFSAELSSDPDDDQLVFLWIFPDGSTADGKEAEYSWAEFGYRNVTLEVDDRSEKNSTSREVHRIYVNAVPVADLGDDREEEVGRSFFVSANLSRDEDEKPHSLSYRWDLDEDGSWDEGRTGIEERITLDREGEYEVRVEVNDGHAVSTDTLVITALIPNEKPVADAGTDLVIPLVSGQGDVELDGSGSYDPDDDANGNGFIDADERDNLTYYWDLDPEEDSDDDGFKTNDRDKKGRTIRFSITDTTSFIVTLNVTDDGGKWDTDQVEISGDNPPEISSIGVNPSGGKVIIGAQVTLTANARDTDRKDVLTYTWDMGDGTELTGLKVNHRYTSIGTFQVILTVNDGYVDVKDESTLIFAEAIERPEISSPRNGSVISGMYQMRGKAYEAAGLPIDRVDISIDGGVYRLVNTRGDFTTWNYDLDTTTLSAGEHTITVRCVIEQGSEEFYSTGTVVVTVDNSQSGGSNSLLVILIVIAIVIVLAGIVILLVRKRRATSQIGPPPGPGPGAPAGGPPPTVPGGPPRFSPLPGTEQRSLPPPESRTEVSKPPVKEDQERKLRIRCPACTRIFASKDNGERPLHLVCSHCGSKGLIDAVPGEDKESPDEGSEEESEPEEALEPVPIICPSCDGLFEMSELGITATCPYCGAEGELDEETVKLLEERFGEEQAGEMMSLRCPRCSHKFEVEEGAAEIECPSCGAKGKI